MKIPIFQVDAFTAAAFRGNPAGVCLLENPAPPEWMQAAAAEMNVAETAFLHPEGAGWRLRWFTPRVEVDLCGHATLASAHILWETGRLQAEAPALFETRSGRLSARRHGERIELDFPEEPASPAPGEAVCAALDIEPARTRFLGRNRFDWLVDLGDEGLVRELRPDFRRLAALPGRGIIVTARSQDPAFDFVSRFFAPAAGVDEDPVTGSAHCCLAPYWGRLLQKERLIGFQASERGGVVEVVLRSPRVLLLGHAVTVLSGHWTAAASP